MSAFRPFNSSEAREILEDLPSDDAMTDEEPSENEAEPEQSMFDEHICASWYFWLHQP